MSTAESPALNPAPGGLTLDQLYKSGDHYALLHHAIPLLRKNADDAALALAVCRSYIAQIKDWKSSPSSLIGTGYDEALQAFFTMFEEGRTITLEEMVQVGMEVVY